MGGERATGPETERHWNWTRGLDGTIAVIAKLTSPSPRGNRNSYRTRGDRLKQPVLYPWKGYAFRTVTSRLPGLSRQLCQRCDRRELEMVMVTPPGSRQPEGRGCFGPHPHAHTKPLGRAYITLPWTVLARGGALENLHGNF